MKIRKSDFSLVIEAKKEGRIVSMINGFVTTRLEKGEELGKYFKSKIENFKGVFDEEESEYILYQINQYLDKNNIEKFKFPISFPYSPGSNTYLIPITENLHINLVVVDEYYGDGDYEKYIDMSTFVINEKTTTTDVDALIDFVKMFHNL